jgi:hypothetical protein
LVVTAGVSEDEATAEADGACEPSAEDADAPVVAGAVALDVPPEEAQAATLDARTTAKPARAQYETSLCDAITAFLPELRGRDA